MDESTAFTTDVIDDMLWLLENAGDACTGDDYGQEWRRTASEVRESLEKMRPTVLVEFAHGVQEQDA